jgi:hypothetical protein
LSNYQKIDKMLDPYPPLKSSLPTTAGLSSGMARRSTSGTGALPSDVMDKLLYDTFNPERLGMQLNWLGTTNT